MDGTSVYLIRVSFLEKNEEKGFELCDDPDVGLFLLLRSIFCDERYNPANYSEDYWI